MVAINYNRIINDELNIDNNDQFKILQHISKPINKLNISDIDIKIFNALPNTIIRHLCISHFEKEITLKIDNYIILRIDFHNMMIDSYKNLPINVNKLKFSLCNLINCFDLQSYNNLTSLTIHACENVINFHLIPNSIKSLTIYQSHEINNLMFLPNNLKKLKIIENHTINNFTKHLPKNIKILYLESCNNISNIDDIPDSLEELYIIDCLKLKQINNLPKSLKKLDIYSLKDNITIKCKTDYIKNVEIITE